MRIELVIVGHQRESYLHGQKDDATNDARHFHWGIYQPSQIYKTNEMPLYTAMRSRMGYPDQYGRATLKYSTEQMQARTVA